VIPLRDKLQTTRRPVVTHALLAANIVAFVVASLSGDQVFGLVLQKWGVVPARLLDSPLSEAPSLFSSMFLHADLLHIGSNMLFLWIFGDNVEEALGRGRFVVFYLLCGLAAALAHVAISPHSPVPMVGASGAIAGVLAAYGSLHPRSPIVVFNPFLPLWLLFGPILTLPAWLIILEFFAVNLISGLTSLHGGGGVAFFAHLGGFAAGIWVVRALLPRHLRRSPLRVESMMAQRSRPPAAPQQRRR